MASSVPDLSIIMCAYNEVARIGPAVEDVLASVDGRTESVEIIIVDNKSTDGTREWLQQLNHPLIRVEFNPTNIGKGGSIKKGFRLSTGQYVVIHDVDLEYRATDIWACLERARQTGAAFVLGSRTLGGRATYVYRQNYLGVMVLTWLINRISGCRITDAATAMKLLEGRTARDLKLDCNGFDLDFELVSRVSRLGGRIEEVGVAYFPRSIAQGKKIRAWRDGAMALWAILRDRLLPVSSFIKEGGCRHGSQSDDDAVPKAVNE